MAKETVGYVHLEWTCPACGGRNDGRAAKCANCGAPQPEDVQFEQAVQEEFIADEKVIAQAEKGPDIHCPFCGTRNPAGATQCQQCMADLSEAVSRQRGQVLGAHRDKAVPDVACPYCQGMNPATARKCAHCGATLERPEARPAPTAKAAPAQRSGGASPVLIAFGALFLVAICAFVLLTLRTEEMVGRVQEVEWTRTVLVEGQVPVEYTDWLDEIPAGAPVESCRQALRRTQDEPAPNTFKVCGTPYTVDTGTGVGEVVQDCVYEVYADMCEYTVEEWQVVDQQTLSGRDHLPRWPEPNLAAGQRLGEREEGYEILFDVDGERYTYRTTDPGSLTQFQADSQWLLEVNSFDAVVSVSPAE